MTDTPTVNRVVADKVRANPLETVADIKQCRLDLALLEYLLTPKPGAEFKDSKRVKYPRCRAAGCVDGPPFFNLNRMGGEPHYVCINHIPKNIDFPLALWGDEWMKTGRNAEGAGGGRKKKLDNGGDKKTPASGGSGEVHDAGSGASLKSNKARRKSPGSTPSP